MLVLLTDCLMSAQIKALTAKVAIVVSALLFSQVAL